MSCMQKITEVAAGLIRDCDKFMICRRPVHKARGGLWEFPGGKIEPGETVSQCLVRECREELDIILTVGDEYMRLIHEYPDLTVRLILMNAVIAEGTPKLLEHSEIKWITAGEIDMYDFCPADEEILEKLKK